MCIRCFNGIETTPKSPFFCDWWAIATYFSLAITKPITDCRLPIADTELLIEIQNLLVEEFDHINSPKAKNLIYSIATITGVKIPKKCAPAGLNILEKRMPSSKPIVRTDDELFKSSINDYLLSLSIKKKEEQKKGLKDYFGKFKTKPIEVFKWEFIFGAV